MNKLLLKGVAAAFCMATMFGTTACGDDDDLVNVEICSTSLSSPEKSRNIIYVTCVPKTTDIK